jgi:regulatory protein
MEPSTTLREGIVTAIEPQRRQKSRVNIFLDGEFAFGLDAEVVLRHKLKKGAALSVDDQKHLLFEEDLKTALNRAFQLLGRRNYSEQEIRRKLELARFHEEIIDRTIARCRELGYLDDAKFARDFVKAQLARRPLGVSRLRAELLRRGISTKVADEI